MTTDNALEPVVIEGRVELVVERSAIERFAGWADAKYSTSYGVDFYAAPGNRCFRLVPTWVLRAHGSRLHRVADALEI